MNPADIYRLTLSVAIGACIGVLVGNLSLGILLSLAAYIAWVHGRLNGLLKWVRNRKEYEAPETHGIFEDITLEIDYLRERHKKRKKKLANYLKQFKQATRALPDATIVLDLDGNVQWANKASEETLGVRWPEDVDQRITNLVRNPELVSFIESAYDGASIDISSPLENDRQFNIRLANYGKAQLLFVARDTTELQRANQIRKDFVANVSHELKTPLTVIKGYVETLSMQADSLPDAFATALEQMEKHTNRMQYLVEDLLLLSQLEKGDAVGGQQPIAVAELISEVHRQNAYLDGAAERIFSLELDPDLYVIGSQKTLHSAFSNLIVNAIRYTNPRDVIEIRWYRDDEGAHFSVEDHGIGIAPEHINRLTERFYRVDSGRDRADGGTGLGLAIVKHALSLHDAQLHIESEPGQGSLFRCDFPPSKIIEPQLDSTAQRSS
ncbi:MAG: phosphate regulon sensor histidine kinase PhoR [Gammaproteobacteria bacterium]